MKRLALHDFLTKRQIKKAFRIFQSADLPAPEISRRVIEPNIESINQKIGQENDPMFLAYVCEFTFSQLKGA